MMRKLQEGNREYWSGWRYARYVCDEYGVCEAKSRLRFGLGGQPPAFLSGYRKHVAKRQRDYEEAYKRRGIS